MRVKPQFTPTGCLLNAIRRDLGKGLKASLAGIRSTPEIVDFTGLPAAKVRRELWKMVERREVFAYTGDPGERGAILWKLKRPLDRGSRVKVVRPIGAVNQVQEAEVEAIIPSCVLPIQVKFEDGHQTGYLHQEIREIVA